MRQSLEGLHRSLLSRRPAAAAAPCLPCLPRRYIALQRNQSFEGVYRSYSYLDMFDGLGLLNASRPFMHFVTACLPSK